jgi:hypothetical protein
MTLLFVAPAAYIVERSGLFGSLRRSVRLSKGHRLQILMIYLFVTLGGLAFSRGMSLLLRSIHNRTVSLIAGYLFQGTYLAVTAVSGIVVYQILLSAREGLEPETIARVFE